MKKEASKNAMKILNKLFPEQMTPGQVIRSKRKNFEITLEEVAEVTGIDIGNLSAIENDKKPIGIKTAIKIGLAIGLHPATILFPPGISIDGDSSLKEIREKAKYLLGKKSIKRNAG